MHGVFPGAQTPTKIMTCVCVFLFLSHVYLSRYPEIPTNIMIDGTAIHAAAAHGFGQVRPILEQTPTVPIPSNPSTLSSCNPYHLTLNHSPQNTQTLKTLQP